MTSDEVYKLIEDNGLTLHGDIEHFAELVRENERKRLHDEFPSGIPFVTQDELERLRRETE
jgi:hypothetical protein